MCFLQLEVANRYKLLSVDILCSRFHYQFTLRCHNQVITSCGSPMGSDLRFGMPILIA